MAIRLRLTRSNVEVVVHERSQVWWEVEVRVGDVPHILGADSPSIILNGLRRAVAHGLPGSVDGTMSGLPVARVFTLCEQHGSVYVSDAAAKRTVFFEDQHARVIAAVALDADEVAAWRQQLGSVSTSP